MKYANHYYLEDVPCAGLEEMSANATGIATTTLALTVLNKPAPSKFCKQQKLYTFIHMLVCILMFVNVYLHM